MTVPFCESTGTATLFIKVYAGFVILPGTFIPAAGFLGLVVDLSVLGFCELGCIAALGGLFDAPKGLFSVD